MDSKYPVVSFSDDNIRFKYVKKRTKIIELPTSIRLSWEFIKYFVNLRPSICIGGDTYGNLLLRSFKRILHFKHICFLLEYPQIITSSHETLSRMEKQDLNVLQKADVIITHDEFHREFLIKNLMIPSDRIMILPNATFTEINYYKSDFLQKRLGLLPDKRIILHSGGLGVWFKSKELAESTVNWPDNTVLVFHTSHKVDDDGYYQEISKKGYNGKVVFSTKPVSTYELDALVCSATIGIALYSKEILGYRAELMGLAAGKIGNYLKCGLPVIATKTLSFQYITDYKCGILVENEPEIAGAIAAILNAYDEFSTNARRCYQELWEPSKYLGTIGSELSAIADK